MPHGKPPCGILMVQFVKPSITLMVETCSADTDAVTSKSVLFSIFTTKHPTTKSYKTIVCNYEKTYINTLKRYKKIKIITKKGLIGLVSDNRAVQFCESILLSPPPKK